MDLKGRQDRLVFVDPEDEEISYWWPAIVVPEEEYELFKETMDNDAGVNVGTHERLVCYFEDGSFSIVPKSGLIPFNPQREPYKSYSTRLKHFLTDAGVKRATEYHNNGQIPKMFKWLVLGETGYLDPAENEEDDDDDEEEEVSEENTATATMGTIGNRKTVTSDQEDDHGIEKKHKKQKDNHKDHKHKDKKKQHKMPPPSKRGRKPKTQLSSASTSEPSDNNTNDSLSIDPILSPQTINPLERMKIEALISSNSNDLVI